MTRPYVLSIAGFDPSGGAGILSDAKTFEANKVTGLGVVSAITYQHENNFNGLTWVSLESMLKQLDILLEKYAVNFVKIGLIESMDVLSVILQFIKKRNPGVRIIWDPVLKASAGFVFHPSPEHSVFESMCKYIYLITPNWEEMQVLYPEIDPVVAARSLSKSCIVYLKGGHRIDVKGKDYLFESLKECVFNPKTISSYDKHGSGCVFSSALAANLARGFPLRKASLRSKNYITHFLLSNKTLLGYHK